MVDEKPLKKKTGRPLAFIDWPLAEKLAGIQCTEREIADVLKINVDTLGDRCKRDHGMSFSDWFKRHSAGGKVSLRRSLWKMATGERPNAAVAIWLSKNYLGMKDETLQEETVIKKMLAYSTDYLQGKNEPYKPNRNKPE